MSIPPIEIAAMVPKSQQVSHFKHQEAQKPFNEQFQLNSQFNNEIKHNNKQTVKTSKSDDNDKRYDAKEKGNNSYHGSNKKNKKKSKDNTPEGYVRPGSIDIKI
jgi:hypothetical protein